MPVADHAASGPGRALERLQLLSLVTNSMQRSTPPEQLLVLGQRGLERGCSRGLGPIGLLRLALVLRRLGPQALHLAPQRRQLSLLGAALLGSLALLALGLRCLGPQALHLAPQLRQLGLIGAL